MPIQLPLFNESNVPIHILTRKEVSMSFFAQPSKYFDTVE